MLKQSKQPITKFYSISSFDIQKYSYEEILNAFKVNTSMTSLNLRGVTYNFFVLSNYSYTTNKDMINCKISEISLFQTMQLGYHPHMKEIDFKSSTDFFNTLQTNPDLIQYKNAKRCNRSFVFTINNYL